MGRRGRPAKALSERTIPTAVKVKHVDYARTSGFTISQYIEYLETTIKYREDNIHNLQKEIQRLNKQIDESKLQNEQEAQSIMQETKENFNNYN